MPQMIERGSGITQSIYYDHQDNPLLRLDTHKLFGQLPVLQLMRDDLTAVLFDAAAATVELRMGVTITGINQTAHHVQATLSDGSEINADLLAGTDGVHSTTRQQVFGKDHQTAHHLGLHCAAFRHPNVTDLNNTFATHTQQGRYMATFNTGSNSADVGSVFVWTDQALEVETIQHKQRLQQAFADSGGRIADHLAHCPDTPFYYDVLKQVELRQWHMGRVVLLGDAAHCLTLFSGRGAAAAITDAAVLAQSLASNPSIAQALQQYDTRLRPALTRMQARTRRDVRWYVPRNTVDATIRNLAFRLAPNALFHRYFQYKYATVGGG